jgi:hypothetical protein
VLDITMPGKSGIEALTEIKRDRPALPVLILSVHSEEQYGPRILKAGASGYLPKDSLPDQLVQAIRKAVIGGKYISPLLAEKRVPGDLHVAEFEAHGLRSGKAERTLRAAHLDPGRVAGHEEGRDPVPVPLLAGRPGEQQHETRALPVRHPPLRDARLPGGL